MASRPHLLSPIVGKKVVGIFSERALLYLSRALLRVWRAGVRGVGEASLERMRKVVTA